MNRRKFLALIGVAGASAAGSIAFDHRHSATFAEATTKPLGPGASGAPSVAPSAVDAATGAPGPNESASTPGGGRSKALVVFFSRAGENYPHLDLAIGNTAQIAGFIHDHVHSDVYEVEPAEAYPASYDATADLAQAEETHRTYRPIKPGAPDTSQYDTIFLGYPIWWGEQPMPLQTFMRDHDLNHAKIVPFCTHEGSQFGNSLSILGQYYPKATVLDGFSRMGHEVHDDPDSARSAVNSWIGGLPL